MIDLEVLGFTKEELRERVIERLVDQMLDREFYDSECDEDGEPKRAKSTKFSAALTAMVQRRIEQAVNKIAAQHIEPSVEEFVRNFTMQKTNEWGDKIGKSVTFTEYLVRRAEAYLAEPVSHDGRAKGDDSYSWRANTTRVLYLIDKNIQYHIEVAMKEALKNANNAIVSGIEAALKAKLQELSAAMKVEVKTR